MESIQQNILSISPSSLSIHRHSRQHAGHAAQTLFRMGNLSSSSNVFGIAISQKDDGRLDRIAIATQNEVHLIDTGNSGSGSNAQKFNENEFTKLLSSPGCLLAGFGMAKIALRIYEHLKCHVRGVDLSALFFNETEVAPPSKVITKSTLCLLSDRLRVDRLWHENDQQNSVEKLCLRAWISAAVACCEKSSSLIPAAKKVDTLPVRKDILSTLGVLVKQNDILARARPRVSTNEFDSFNVDKKGKMKLVNSRYKTRVRVSTQSYVEVKNNNGATYRGTAKRVQGKTTKIQFNHKAVSNTKDIRTVTVIGVDELTTSEKAQESLLLRVLHRDAKLLDSDFVRYLWFRTQHDIQRLNGNECSALSTNGSFNRFIDHLNSSQTTVVEAMASVVGSPIVVVHGPPGTGKTTTISSAAEIWSKAYKEPVWIIGHSNVCVKNIAEKLLQRKVDFKLIVSKEFYVEWHEHIYEKIEERIIRTDRLPKTSLEMSRVMGGSTVILSTLGLLSNPALDMNGTFDIVPVRQLVIDEASQINVFEYIHVFYKFRNTLAKVCFFGDPKQLPPFGQEKAKTLKSVFELKHLQANSYFLDVQYRMPVHLGNFISTLVYSSRLKSYHTIKDFSCVRFVNVPKGVETRNGFSWTNVGEISTIVYLVRNYYRLKNFCVITPYDGQRAAIQKQLKQEGLPWEQVFNVDSFQGNEADYVLISLVRSNGVGFLQSPHRVNVMLTRCRRGMVVVSSKPFLQGVARKTLVGKLCAYWDNAQRGNDAWVNAEDVLNSRADLPGVESKKRDPLILAMSKLSIASPPRY